MRVANVRGLGALVLVLAACPQAPVQAPDLLRGRFHVDFQWPAGLPWQNNLWVLVRAEEWKSPAEHTVLDQDGPKPFTRGGSVTLDLQVSNGTQRVVVVEFRREKPLSDRVVYYGFSQPFDLQPMQQQDVAVTVPLRAAPCEHPDDAGAGCDLVIAAVDGGPVTVTNQADVSVWVQGPVAAALRLSNLRDLPPELSAPSGTGAASGDGGMRWKLDWNLNGGLADKQCDHATGCPRRVFAQLLDEYGYPSQVLAADTTWDVVQPALVAGSGGVFVAPQETHERGHSTLQVRANELLRKAPELQVNGDYLPGVTLTMPENRDTASAVYQYVMAWSPPDGGCAGQHTVTLQAHLNDLADNPTGWLALGSVRVDCDAPALETASAAPLHVKAEGEVTVRFTVNKDLGSAPPPQVSINGDVVGNATWEGSGYALTHTVQAGDAEGPMHVQVRLQDAAGHDVIAELADRPEVDLQAPRVSHAPPPSVAYTPVAGPDGRRNALAAPQAAGDLAEALVTVAASEAVDLREQPTLEGYKDLDGGAAHFWLGSAEEAATPQGAAALLHFPVRTDGGAGTYFLKVGWQDLAGNLAQEALRDTDGGLLTVSIYAGPATLVVDQEALMLVRSPWGQALPERLGDCAVQSGASLVVAPAASLGDCTLPGGAFALAEPGRPLLQVRFWARPRGCSVFAQDRVQNLGAFPAPAEQGGVWPRLALNAPDAPGVVVTGVDPSGTETAPVALEHTEWVVTAQPSATGDNPHRFVGVRAVGPTHQPRRGVSTELAQELHAADGTGLTVTAAPWWEEKQIPTAAMATRPAVAMAYDPYRGRTVLFGGMSASATVMEWTGANWEEAPAEGSSPATRTGHGMAYNPVRNRIAMFGGTVGQDRVNDLWEWDGKRWTSVLTCTQPGRVCPAGREGFGMAYDTRAGKLLVFGGGRFDSAADFAIRDDLWSWDGVAWKEELPLGPSPVSARGMPAMAYDEARGVTVVVGGLPFTMSMEPVMDVWEWDGTAWAERVLPPWADQPPARTAAALAYDRQRHSLLLFGGCDVVSFSGGAPCARALNDLWEWNGTAGTWAPLDTPVSVRPEPRAAHAMAYDEARGVMVMFGGYCIQNDVTIPGCDATWEWDGRRWHQRMVGAPRPEALASPGVAFYPPLQQTLVLSRDGQNWATVWGWDGFTWQQFGTDGGVPRGRWRAAFEADPADGGLVLSGGFDSRPEYVLRDAGIDTRLDDTWKLGFGADGEVHWEEQVTAVHPGARDWAAGAPDCLRGGVVMTGGQVAGEGFLTEVWHWATGWSRDAEGPPGARGASMACDQVRQRVVWFGGQLGQDTHGSPMTNATWEFNGATWTRRTADDPDAGPGPRCGHGMAYDRRHQRTLVYGGFNTFELYQDLWEWDGQRWTARDMTGSTPGSTGEMRLVYDESRDRLVGFGGLVNSSSGSVWELVQDDTRQPALQWSVAVPPETRGRMELLRVRARAGGSAPSCGLDGGPCNGAALWGWVAHAGMPGVSGYGWQPLGPNADAGVWAENALGLPLVGAADAGVALATTLEWTQAFPPPDPDAGVPEPLVQDAERRMSFQLRPRGHSGGGLGEARVEVDYVEVRVRYRQPSLEQQQQACPP